MDDHDWCLRDFPEEDQSLFDTWIAETRQTGESMRLAIRFYNAIRRVDRERTGTTMIEAIRYAGHGTAEENAARCWTCEYRRNQPEYAKLDPDGCEECKRRNRVFAELLPEPEKHEPF